jgi:hypothetical protein
VFGYLLVLWLERHQPSKVENRPGLKQQAGTGTPDLKNRKNVSAPRTRGRFMLTARNRTRKNVKAATGPKFMKWMSKSKANFNKPTKNIR